LLKKERRERRGILRENGIRKKKAAVSGTTTKAQNWQLKQHRPDSGRKRDQISQMEYKSGLSRIRVLEWQKC